MGMCEDGSVGGRANSVIRTGRENLWSQLEGARRTSGSLVPFDEDDPYLLDRLQLAECTGTAG